MKCGYCNEEFEPRPRFRKFCSTACKNPINRKGNVPWNKGMQGRQDWMNIEGLKKGHGWNKGLTYSFTRNNSSRSWQEWLASDEFKRSQKEKAEKGREVIETMKEEVAEKKSISMGKTIANGYRPQDNAGWGGGGRPKEKEFLEYEGAGMTVQMKEYFETHLNKE